MPIAYFRKRIAERNGQVEGQVNRLKMLKRQTYVRVNFDFLRRRVLHHVAWLWLLRIQTISWTVSRITGWVAQTR